MHLNDPDYSKLRALKLIRRMDGLSRVELAEALGFNKATVTELAAELLRRGLLVEERAAAQGRGRPRTQLSIDATAGYAISLFPLMNANASVDIIDLRGRRIHHREVAMGPLDDMDSLPDNVAGALDVVLAEDIVPRSAIRHAAIVLPGLVSHRDGIVHWLPPNNHMGELPLARMIEDRIGIAVSLDNRAAAIARAEHWFGMEGELDNFTLIALLEVGMNAARYVDGRMQIGNNGLNSEFAHVKVAFEGGRPCYCGSEGCLTTYASVSGIAAAFGKMTGADVASLPHRERAFNDALRLATEGSAPALALFEIAAMALGTAVANHINEHDPGRVLIICARADMMPFIEFRFRQVVRERTLAPIAARTQIDLHALDESYFWKGMAALALEGLYRSGAI